MEASLLRKHNIEMQMRYDENISEMKVRLFFFLTSMYSIIVESECGEGRSECRTSNEGE